MFIYKSKQKYGQEPGQPGEKKLDHVKNWRQQHGRQRAHNKNISY